MSEWTYVDCLSCSGKGDNLTTIGMVTCADCMGVGVVAIETKPDRALRSEALAPRGADGEVAGILF